jgi:hypothetical protein
MTGGTARDGGPADRYLDEMFDRLAGTGTDGRRLLSEAEEHLTEAVAEARARGLDADAAEREAVRRFGTVTTVVRHLPVTAGNLSISLRRLTTATWAVAGAAMAWYGLSGIATWLLSGPWVALLVATDRFGTQPMCSRPWIPEDATDCAAVYRSDLSAVPWGGARYPFVSVAAIGLLLIVALLVLRRTTRIGTPAWTPARTATGLAFAVPFGAVGLLLLFYGTLGMLAGPQDHALSHLVAALSAGTIGVIAARRLRRRPAAEQPAPPAGP